MTTSVGKYFDEGMRLWIIQTARSNHWRVASWCDLEDLIQDGYLCYCKCAAKYPFLMSRHRPSREDKRHFMALLQVSYLHHITDLANDKTESPKEYCVSQLGSAEEGADIWEHISPRTEAEVFFNLLLEKAPKEVRALIDLLIGDVTRAVSYRREGGVRETSNEYYCRLLRLDPEKFDLITLTKNHFQLE